MIKSPDELIELKSLTVKDLENLLKKATTQREIDELEDELRIAKQQYWLSVMYSDL